jgi:ABC-type transport system involved in multi-copper enzyme maturation permease subunit
MTVTLTSLAAPPNIKSRVLLRDVVRATWVLHRTMFVNLFLVMVGAGAAILVGHASSSRTSLSGFIQHGCGFGGDGACDRYRKAIASDVVVFHGIVIAISVLPILIGVFVGAPLLSREKESGTFRFAWTQEVGRSRLTWVQLAAVVAIVAVGTSALGALLGAYAHGFEVADLDSRWEPGLFDATWLTLPAFSVLAVATGALVGAVMGRVVAAMAVTAAVLAGFVLGFFLFLEHLIIGVGGLATPRLSPYGLGVGSLGLPSTHASGSPQGSWLIRGWFGSVDGGAISAAARRTIEAGVYANNLPIDFNPTKWLTIHHFAYWVAYQPSSSFWPFQIALLVLLALLTAAASLVAVRHLRRG